jgi:hypothetical protein
MRDKPSLQARQHRWDIAPKNAVAIQHFSKIRTVAGLNAAFVLVHPQTFKTQTAPKRLNRWNALREANHAIGCVVMYRYPAMKEVDRAYAILRLNFPYVPGFLSFREIPVLLAALAKLKTMPDLLFCDAHGFAHPRRMGLATHLGIVLDRPTIGCAKSILIGTHGKLAKAAGSWSPLLIKNRAWSASAPSFAPETGCGPSTYRRDTAWGSPRP